MSKADFAEVHPTISGIKLVEIKDAVNPRQTWKQFLNGHVQPNLLQTCKLIHKEATPILYGNNHFLFVKAEAMDSFLGKIGNSIESMTRISLVCYDHTHNNEFQRPAFHKLAKAVNLQALILEKSFLRGMADHHRGFPQTKPSRMAEAFYRVAYGWLWTMATIKGGVEAASEVLRFPKGGGFSTEYDGDTRQLQSFASHRHNRQHDVNFSMATEASFCKELFRLMD